MHITVSYFLIMTDHGKQLLNIYLKMEPILMLKTLNGYTLLHSAAEQAISLQSIKFLVENGADINAETKYKSTALMDLSLLGRFAMVKYLVENKANVNAQSIYGETALMKASKARTFRNCSILSKK